VETKRFECASRLARLPAIRNALFQVSGCFLSVCNCARVLGWRTINQNDQHLMNPASAPDGAAAELHAAVAASAAHIPSKYLYDRLGSRLFEAICELPEYYPTRTEAAIFAQHGAAMVQRTGTGASLIDLGAGNCAKAASLFPLLQPRQYVPVDISRGFLFDAAARLQQRFPGIDMVPLVRDLSGPFDLPGNVRSQGRVAFYPGSSIGNFAPADAIAFLQRVRANVPGGGLLIGIDLVKDSAVLQQAYADAIGVTAAFNLNVLHHVNRLAGFDFDPRRWRHVALFNISSSRIEMHLEAACAQTVTWPGGSRTFAPGERIHTENSYKYTEAGFAHLLGAAGFAVDACWTDAAGWFAVFYARTPSPSRSTP
jgi:dimethylhistidine N-methyltransferase